MLNRIFLFLSIFIGAGFISDAQDAHSRATFDDMLKRIHATRNSELKKEKVTRGSVSLYSVDLFGKYGVLTERGDYLVLPAASEPVLKNNSFYQLDEEVLKGRQEEMDSLSLCKLFVENMVQTNMAVWEKKDEFETTAQYRERQANQYYGMAYGYYLGEALRVFAEMYGYSGAENVGDYDMDHETFLVTTPFGSVPLYVPASASRDFRAAQRDRKLRVHELAFYYEQGQVTMTSASYFIINQLLEKSKDALYYFGYEEIDIGNERSVSNTRHDILFGEIKDNVHYDNLGQESIVRGYYNADKILQISYKSSIGYRNDSYAEYESDQSVYILNGKYYLVTSYFGDSSLPHDNSVQ